MPLAAETVQMARPLKLLTFNVNGVRSIRDYYAQSKLSSNLNFEQFLDSFGVDILCFQEHKANHYSKLTHDLGFPQKYLAYYAFPRVPKKIGYSGVVTFIKSASPWAPIAWFDGFSGIGGNWPESLQASPKLNEHYSAAELSELDSEGRCIVTDHSHFLLMNIYFPNDSGPERAEYRSKFYRAVLLRCFDLIENHGKSIVVLGDINIAYHPLDHCEYATAFRQQYPDGLDMASYLEARGPFALPSDSFLLNEFYSNPMRRWLAEWLYLGRTSVSDKIYKSTVDTKWTDCFRESRPFLENQDKYTCWNALHGARGSNYGTRIDAIFTMGPFFSPEFNVVQLRNCDIMPKIMGSDHCPVKAELDASEDVLSLNDSVLQQVQLRKGNVPKHFGCLDNFFSTKKRDSASISDSVESNSIEAEKIVVDSLEKPESKASAKRTLLDYFSKAERANCDMNSSEEIETTNVAATEATKVVAIESSISGPELIDSSCSLANALNSSSSDWASAFRQPKPPPSCDHGESCRLNRVKKAGPNRGRSFYTCARPVGPPNDPQARCNFFQWLNGSNDDNK